MSYIVLLLLFYNVHPTLNTNITSCYYSQSYRTTCCIQHNSSINSITLYCPPRTNTTSIGTLGPPIPYCTYYYSRGCCVRNIPTDYADPTPRYTTEYFCPPKIGVSVCGAYCLSMVVFAILGSLCCYIGCVIGIASLAIIVYLLVENRNTNMYNIKKARDRQNRYSRSGQDDEREVILEEICPDITTSSVPFQTLTSANVHSKNSTLPIQDLENGKLYYDEAPSVCK